MRKQNMHIEVTKLPVAIPVDQKEVPPLYIFRKDIRKNPYSEIAANFLNRQMILYSHFSLITAIPLRQQLNFFGYVLYIREHKTNNLVTVDQNVAINTRIRQ